MEEEDCRDPPETFDDEWEHFDDPTCRGHAEEGEAATDCRDDNQEDGRVTTNDGDVFVDPLANECFDDVTEIRDLPPRGHLVATSTLRFPSKEPISTSCSNKDIADGNLWSSPTTQRGGTIGSEASNNIPQWIDHHNAHDHDEEDDEHNQSFGKGSSTIMDSYSYTYSDSSASGKENAHSHNAGGGMDEADDLEQRRMDIAGELIQTLSTANDDGDDASYLKLIAVLGILSSMSEDGALEEEEEDEAGVEEQATDAKVSGAGGSGRTATAKGDESYSNQVEAAVASAATIAAEIEATMPPETTTSKEKEADKETSVEAPRLKELLGLAPDFDYASVVANLLESKEIRGGIDKVAQDIAIVLETFDISINIENLHKENAGAGGRIKPAPLQTTNATKEEEREEEGVDGSISHQEMHLGPFIRTKSLSPISGGKESNEDCALVSSSSRSASINSFFCGLVDGRGGGGKMQKKVVNNDSIKNAVEDVPCLKASRFKGGALLELSSS